MKLDAYESDLPWLRFGQKVEFEAEAVPGKTFQGTVAFIAPVLDPKTRTVDVRVNAENPDFLLKPEMFVRAKVLATVAQGGKVVAPELAGKWISPMHPEIVRDKAGPCPKCGMDLVKAEDLGYSVVGSHEQPLVVPASAVLLTGKRAIVYVEKPKEKQPTYEGREITIGPRAGEYYIVADGLEQGELVVSEGSFKIDSAVQILAKPSMMNPKEEKESELEGWELSPEGARDVFSSYFDLQEALAADDLEASQKVAGQLSELATVQSFEPAKKMVAQLSSAKDLEGLRKEFEPLSLALIQLAPSYAGPDLALFQAHCPMAFKNQGGDWLQRTDQLRNPYFGARMLKCGDIEPVKPDDKQTE